MNSESMISYNNTQLDLLKVLNEIALVAKPNGFNSDSVCADATQIDVLLRNLCLKMERENKMLAEENRRL